MNWNPRVAVLAQGVCLRIQVPPKRVGEKFHIFCEREVAKKP